MDNNNINNVIKNLKSYERENFLFTRTRINRGDGKKTIGWVLKDTKNNLTFENKDYNILYEKKILLEGKSNL
jgi:hypothetical protein